VDSAAPHPPMVTVTWAQADFSTSGHFIVFLKNFGDVRDFAGSVEETPVKEFKEGPLQASLAHGYLSL
jgi:hypothetical protein